MRTEEDSLVAMDVQVWQLRITIHCLADAGNLLDCACLAGITALKHFRRPEVEVVGDEVTVVCLFFPLLLSSITHPALSFHLQIPNDMIPIPSTHHLLAPQFPSRSTTPPSASPSPTSLLPPTPPHQHVSSTPPISNNVFRPARSRSP